MGCLVGRDVRPEDGFIVRFWAHQPATSPRLQTDGKSGAAATESPAGTSARIAGLADARWVERFSVVMAWGP